MSRLSRRALLQGLAALPLACSARPGSRAIAGSIVGPDHARGHRLRELRRPDPRTFQETTVAIVGAGMAGLSAAWALERAGLTDFVVLELEDEPGGTARWGEGPVSPYPWAAHYVPVPSPANRPLVALLEEVGALAGRDPQGRPQWAEDVLCRAPQERVFFRGRWYEGLYPRSAATRDDLAQLGAFEQDVRRWAAFRDAAGRPAFALPRVKGSDAAEVRELDRLSMRDYLDLRGWRSERLRWLVEYGCRDDFGAALHQTSAWAGLHYHAARLERPGDEPAEYLTWPEGNGRLVRHLAALAGARLRTGQMVAQVKQDASTVEVRGLDSRTGEPFGLRARHVVFALPTFLRPFVIDPAPPPLPGLAYGPWVVANLTLRDRPQERGFPLSWDNVLYSSPSLGYVVATHQAGRDHGATVFTYYRPYLDDDPRRDRQRLLSTRWEEWVEEILADLEPAHPDIRELVDRVDVFTWGHAMVRPLPGFPWSGALARAREPLGRIRFAHTDLSAMALVEEAQHWGVAAAEDILRAERRAFRSWLS